MNLASELVDNLTGQAAGNVNRNAAWQPTRRQLIRAGSLAIAGAALPRAAFAAPLRPLSFLVIGDWGRDGIPQQKAVATLAGQLARQYQCDFVLSTGDNFYNWGVPSVTAPEWSKSYESVYDPILKKNWFAVLGNHDYSGSVAAQFAYRSPGWEVDRSLPKPWGWRMDNRWWELRLDAFDRSDVHLFFIDTVHWEGAESWLHALHGDSVQPGYRELQRKWLARRLKASDARFKLVIGHHPIYSVGNHGGEARNRELDDILRYGNATAYIHGHDHCLYHIQSAGMDYICSGAGSRIKRLFTGGPDGCVLKDFCPDPANPEPYLPRWLSYLEDGGVARFSVTSASVTFEFRTIGGVQSKPVTIQAKT